MQVRDEIYRGRILEVVLGASPGLSIGGDESMPFESTTGARRPLLCLEIAQDWSNWPELLVAEASPGPMGDWARRSANAGADILCLRLGTRSDDTRSLSEYSRRAIEDVGAVLGASQNCIVVGSGNTEEDNAALTAIAEEYAGRGLVLGNATQENYRAITASCIAHGHLIIAESPIDINICKQLNILIAEAGLPLDRVIIDPTTGGLGYGIEYTYSIMEKARIAALSGDRTLACPQICFVGAENWKAKEATREWEAAAATALIMAGAHIAVMRDPFALGLVREYLNNSWGCRV